jgi:hypothetical protein
MPDLPFARELSRTTVVEPVSVDNKRVSAQLHDPGTEIGKFRPETGVQKSATSLDDSAEFWSNSMRLQAIKSNDSLRESALLHIVISLCG